MWKLHWRFVLGLGAVIGLVVVTMLTTAPPGLNGLGHILGSFALLLGYCAHFVLTTLLASFARARKHVVLIHLLAPPACIGVLALVFR